MITPENVINLKDRAELLKALASPKRLVILSLIVGREGITTSEVKDSLDMSHGNTEFHLRRLHQAGIVEKNRNGKRKIYKINEKMS